MNAYRAITVCRHIKGLMAYVDIKSRIIGDEIMTITEKMRWNLVNQGFTATTSKKAATELCKWANEKGIAVHTDEVKGRTFVLTDEE